MPRAFYEEEFFLFISRMSSGQMWWSEESMGTEAMGLEREESERVAA